MTSGYDRFVAKLSQQGGKFNVVLKDIRNAIPRKYYRLLPAEQGTPRIESAAVELADATAGELDGEKLQSFFAAYQESRHLTLAELWAAIHMVRLALLDRVIHGQTVEAATESLRKLETLTWKNIVEKISFVERILREDPSGDYPRLDFESRDMYRHAVEQCGRRSRKKEEDPALAEERVARTAIDLANRDLASTDLANGPQALSPAARTRHIGYWLIDKGCDTWHRACGYHHEGIGARRFILKHPNFAYLTTTALFTALIITASALLLKPIPAWCLLLLLLPAVHVALAILNPLVTFTLSPKRYPGRVQNLRGDPHSSALPRKHREPPRKPRDPLPRESRSPHSFRPPDRFRRFPHA